MSKLILNIQFSSQVKFKIAYQITETNKTFGSLKELCINRLSNFAQVAPANLQQEIPSVFDPNLYILQDSDSFNYDDLDEVNDFCQNNDIVRLAYLPNITPQQQVPQQEQSIPLNRKIIEILDQSIKPQKQSQLVPLNQSIPDQIVLDQIPLANSVPPVIQPINNVFPAKQQIPNGMIDQRDLKNLKQAFYLDTQQINQRQQFGDFEFQIRFLQAQDQEASYKFKCQTQNYLSEVSAMICETLNLDAEKHSVSLYSLTGQPLYAGLNQMHSKTVEETLGKTIRKIYYAIITKCSSGQKSHPKIDPESGSAQIFVIHEGPKVIRVNIDSDTVLVLKQKVFSKLNIPTNITQLFYGGKCLQDELLLKDYNIQSNSNLQISFKFQQIVGYADSYAFNFYSPWMDHLTKQSDQGLREFRCHSMVIMKHYTKIEFLALIRLLSKNNSPLLLTIYSLNQCRRLNQLQKIALEEGMMRLFFDLIVSSPQIPTLFTVDKIFEYSRKCYGLLINQCKEMKDSKQYLLQEKYKNIELQCAITLTQIKNVALLQPNLKNLDINEWLVVDYEQIQEKVTSNQVDANNVLFSDLKLVTPDWIKEEFFLVQNLDHESFIWVPQQDYVIKQSQFQLEEDWHKNGDDLSLGQFKIHSGTELKAHPNAPVLTKNSNKQLVVYTSMNKDVNKPVNLFDPMNGLEQPENPDDMAYQQVRVMTGSISASNDSDDDSDIKVVTQITTIPDEAIVVLLDISGSMEEQFYKSDDLTRLGVVKAFFNAFADRTMAYNLKNVISLAYFDDRYILKCGFTELFMQFKDLVNRAKPQGTTALYTALQNAAESLIEFKKLYPNTILRIIALTDGEDNRSKVLPLQVATIINNNGIILDSFVAYDKSFNLLQITKSTGGRCFCPKTIQEGLKLFEYETILTAKCRKEQNKMTLEQVKKTFKLDPKTLPFDVEPYEITLPNQLDQQSIHPKQLVTEISSDSKQLNLYAPSATLKRVIKEIMCYESKPHPFVKIFPCQNDISFWKILMLGPEQTPYYGGAYTLFLRFPSNYPQNPPELRFLTPIYHCNINAQGRICHSIFGRNYSPDLRVVQLFQAVYGLLMTPEPDDPLDTTIASEYMQNLQLYRQKATNHTNQYAKKPVDEIMKQILGKENNDIVVSDVELQQKICEIDKWIAQSLNQNQE